MYFKPIIFIFLGVTLMTLSQQEVLNKTNPRIGVGALLMRNGKLLFGKRKGSHGSYTWCNPGGHLEFGETTHACAQREILEETGLVINNLQPLAWTDDIFEQSDKHYVSIFYVTEDFQGEPQLLEPDKCESWKWFGLDELPSPLFLSIKHLLENKKALQILKDIASKQIYMHTTQQVEVQP